MKKQAKSICVFLTILLIFVDTITVFAANTQTSKNTTGTAKQTENIKGVWLSYVDQQMYLKGKEKREYDETFDSICKTAKKYGLNTIFVHVRSHNDAIYPSEIYPWSSEMLNGTDPGFNPLVDMVGIAHKNNLKIHAWINPYGYRNGNIYGDASLATENNIAAGVEEILDLYAVDGIHFDDYFPPAGAKTINSMVHRVHEICEERRRIFGIAPQGNIDNCLAAGADVKTWLSQKGYIDYIAPQIYWTDNYGADGGTTMSSDRLKAWKELNTAGITMYVGMALYRAGSPSASDRGWSLATDNLSRQYKKAKSLGYEGYIIYNTASIIEPNASMVTELSGLTKSEN